MKANPHFCSPKLYFLPNMQMSKNTFSASSGKGVWSELLDSRQTSKWWCLANYIAISLLRPPFFKADGHP